MSGVIPALTIADAGNGTGTRNNEDCSSGWGLKSLADKIWNLETTAPKDSGGCGVMKSPLPTPFSGLFSSSQDTPAAEASKQQQNSTPQQDSGSSTSSHHRDSHAAVDEATQTDSEDSDQEHDLSASSDGEAASDGEWEDTEDDDQLPSISDLLARCWYGISLDSNTSSPKAQQHDRRRLLKHSSSLNRGRQLSLTRKKADTSWTPSWVRKAFTKPSLLNRSASWHAKPLMVKVAEQVLGEGLVSAIDLVQRDILESGEPLPEATIKFFVKAAAGVATCWAHSNLNRVFMAFGAYVAATCGAMHFTKKAVKWLACKWPWGGKKALGPAVTFTADVLLPTQFFGPWLATYVVCKVVVQERHRLRAAEKAGADKETVVTAAIGAALEPDSNQQLQQQQQQHEEEKDKQQQQQHQQQQHQKLSNFQYKPQLARASSLQRSGSLVTRHSRGFRAGLKAKRKPRPGRQKPHPVQVPVSAMSTQPSGDVWGIKDP